MISVVMVTARDPMAVATLLEELVPSAVNGLVREVILPTVESTPETRAIADDAGATFVDGTFDVAVGAAKSRWVMIVEASVPRPEGWLEKVARHVSGGSGEWRIAGRWPWSASPGVLRPRG
jgi:hypothetical protein